MHTPQYEAKLNDITRGFLDTILRLENKLTVSSDNHGVQFKVNTEANWKGTIGLRCNYVYLESISGYISEIVTSLAQHQTLPLLEYISIARAHETDPTTNRKRSVPWQKTMFVTFRPPKDTFEKLRITLADSIETYAELDTLIAALRGLTDG